MNNDQMLIPERNTLFVDSYLCVLNKKIINRDVFKKVVKNSKQQNKYTGNHERGTCLPGIFPNYTKNRHFIIRSEICFKYSPERNTTYLKC